jgi:uncharacterized protein (TIGR00369 family)
VRGPHEAEPFARWAGLRLGPTGTVAVTLRPELINSVGLMLGPVAFALVDYAMSDVVWATLDRDLTAAVTVSATINYLDSCAEGVVTCTAQLDRRGGRVAGTSARVHAPDGRLLATALGTFAIVTSGAAAPDPR